MPNATRPIPNEINIPIIKEEKDMSWFNKPQEITNLNVNSYRITVCDEYNKNSEDVSLVIGGKNELYRTLLVIESNGIAKGYRKIGAENIYNTLVKEKCHDVKITFSPKDSLEFYLRHKDLNKNKNYLYFHWSTGYYFDVKERKPLDIATKFKEADTYIMPKSIIDNCVREYVETEDK